MDNKLKFELNRVQLNALNGLGHWRADLSYCLERFPDDSESIDQAENSITSLFSSLDRLGVPFWVQNVVLCWAENWRAYQSTYFSDFLKSKNIVVA